jgi:hypothetical protein
MYYVINTQTKVVEHEDKSEVSARQWINNVLALHLPRGEFTIVKGAKARKEMIGQ